MINVLMCLYAWCVNDKCANMLMIKVVCVNCAAALIAMLCAIIRNSIRLRLSALNLQFQPSAFCFSFLL